MDAVLRGDGREYPVPLRGDPLSISKSAVLEYAGKPSEILLFLDLGDPIADTLDGWIMAATRVA